ncbi:hypothetical protein K1719_010892 [Acacia pycnantha]|nr:hypothetical protein K1719_010892 [Acacia pycnantha]
MGSVSDSGNSTASSSSTVSSPPSAAQIHISPWQSPLPYLFGGFAAVFCLIMFSLLMLAFSYRRQSAGERQGGIAQMEIGIGTQKQSESGVAESVHAYEQKILVIMAGDEQPTFLATPVCAKCSSLGEGFEEAFQEGDDENRENSQKTDKATSSTTPPENGGADSESQQHNM